VIHRVLAARALNRIVWRWPGRDARKLHAFARAEEGSRVDLLLAARRTRSTARRALYLRHAVDEARHALMFARRADELRAAANAAPLGSPRADGEALFDRLGEVRFLAFVHRGEARGRAQFEAYRDHFAAAGDARTRAMFEAILGDERRHEEYTRALLVELAGGEGAARRALRWAAAWEAWRTWRRAGRFVAERLFVLTMMALYVALAPVGLILRLTTKRRG
jgi:rubrerythrin